MTTAENKAELRVTPPGPGFWELDPVHFPRPMTRYWTEIHPDALTREVQRVGLFAGPKEVGDAPSQ